MCYSYIYMSKEESPNELFKLFVDDYYKKYNNEKELEIRFGTKYYNPITRIKFENVIQKQNLKILV